MRKICGVLLVALMGAVVLGSCNREMFNQEWYDDTVTEQFPIEPIDTLHQWLLSARRIATIKVDAGLENMERVMVLTANPIGHASEAQIMAEENDPKEGGIYTLLFAAPEAQTTFYAAIKTTDNRYAVVPFTASAGTVDFSNKTIATITTPLAYHSFTYCFEEDFPVPGDYDFNDCVLRMSVQPGSKKNQVKLNVTLAAVGAKKVLAAAVKLTNYSYDDIESVEIEGGRAFDEDYPLQLRLIRDGATFQRGRNNEPVIRLFEDASWSMARNEADNIGNIERRNINVTRDTNEVNLHIEPVTRTYVINFKEDASGLLNNLLEDNLDPFIVTLYNGGFWETHTYNYRRSQVFYEYHDQTKLRMIWALCVPTGTFRWPLEGQLIGNYKDGILTGVFREYGHSFGQWAANRNSSKDWFFYPSLSDVY